MSLSRTTDAADLAHFKKLFKDLTAGVPTHALPDFGYGPMAYVGDDMYITKSGHWFEDDDDDTETDD